MILLGSFLHRHELAEIIGRALEDRSREDDAYRIKVIVNFNSYLVRLYTNHLAAQIFNSILPGEVNSFSAKTKGILKDLIVKHPPCTNKRVNELIAQYNRFPQDFYRETPFEGLIFVNGDPPVYVGSRRIKRIRRIAEKCARRIMDYITDQIEQRAEEISAERASDLGIPKERLIISDDEMIKEYQHAERRVLKSIRNGAFVAAMPQFFIDDIVGLRILIDDASADRVNDYISSNRDFTIVEEKEFSGRFNARNMVVIYRLDKEMLLENPPSEEACRVLVSRGVAAKPEEIEDHYRKFVSTAEEYVRFEILLNDYQELLESEIGLSMHEEHIRTQRERPEYSTHLAQNVEALMVFLFAYSLSARTIFKDLPIKLSGTYLPDYFETVLRSLYITPTGSLGLTM